MSAIESKTLTDQTGHQFTIRNAQPDDAAAVLTYIRSVAEKTDFFVIQPDEFPATVEEEQSWIQDHLDHPGKIILLAEADGDIIGSVTFEAGTFRRIAHRGNLGLAVVKAWRRKGVGTALLQALLDWAEASPVIDKVCLDVFAINEPAIRLYKKLGFIEEGRRIRDIKRGTDDFVDTVMMFRLVK
jgi:RimJ/RimL family protein N-acetyltransferase